MPPVGRQNVHRRATPQDSELRRIESLEDDASQLDRRLGILEAVPQASGSYPFTLYKARHADGGESVPNATLTTVDNFSTFSQTGGGTYVKYNTGTGIIDIVKGGVYAVEFRATWNSFTGSRYLQIEANTLLYRSPPGVDNEAATMSMTVILYSMPNNSTVKAQVYQSSGSTQSVSDVEYYAVLLGR